MFTSCDGSGHHSSETFAKKSLALLAILPKRQGLVPRNPLVAPAKFAAYVNTCFFLVGGWGWGSVLCDFTALSCLLSF